MDTDSVARQIAGQPEETVLLRAHHDGGQLSLSDVDIVTGSRHYSAQTAHELRELGLVDRTSTLGGDLTLTAQGRQLAEKIEASVTSGPRRLDALRRGILRWLDETDTGVVQRVDDFVDDPGASFMGHGFTRQELIREGSYLNEQGLIRGAEVDQSDVLFLPRITASGRDSLHSSGLMGQPNAGGSVFHDHSTRVTTGSHSQIGGIQAGGQDNTQEVTQVLSAENRNQALHYADRLLDLVDRVPVSEEQRQQLRAAADEVKDVALSEHPSRSRVRDAAGKVLIAGATSLATTEGQQIAQVVAHLLHVSQ